MRFAALSFITCLASSVLLQPIADAGPRAAATAVKAGVTRAATAAAKAAAARLPRRQTGTALGGTRITVNSINGVAVPQKAFQTVGEAAHYVGKMMPEIVNTDFIPVSAHDLKQSGAQGPQAVIVTSNIADAFHLAQFGADGKVTTDSITEALTDRATVGADQRDHRVLVPGQSGTASKSGLTVGFQVKPTAVGGPSDTLRVSVLGDRTQLIRGKPVAAAATKKATK